MTVSLCVLALAASLCSRSVVTAVDIAVVLYAVWTVARLRPDLWRGLRGIRCLQAPVPHLLLFLAVLAAVLPFSTDIERSALSLLEMTAFLGTSFGMLVCLRRCSPGAVTTSLVFHAVLLGDVIDALYGLYQVHTTGQLHVNGFNPHYVYFGFQVAQGVLLATALLLAARTPLRRAVYAGVVFILGLALLCSQARGPWIGLAAAYPMVVALSRRSFGHHRRWTGICLGATALLALCLAPLYIGHLLTIFDLSVASNRERVLIWGSTLHMIRDHPLAGVGAGQFAAIYNTRYISPASVERWHPHAHNSFLQILSEDGLFGLAAALSFMYGVTLLLRDALSDNPSSPYIIGTVGAFCALLVSGLVDCFLFTGWVRSEWVFWLLLGLVYYDRPTPSCNPTPSGTAPAEYQERTPV